MKERMRKRRARIRRMNPSPLTLLEVPAMKRSTLLVALTGWMDGGEVSTGTVRGLMDEKELVHVASISPAGFYIDSFPGSMEIAALFRPHVKYAGGLVEEFEMAENDFHADSASNIAFFIGREPNMNWIGFGDYIFRSRQEARRRADHLHGQLRRIGASHARAAPFRIRLRCSLATGAERTRPAAE